MLSINFFKQVIFCAGLLLTTFYTKAQIDSNLKNTVRYTALVTQVKYLPSKASINSQRYYQGFFGDINAIDKKRVPPYGSGYSQGKTATCPILNIVGTVLLTAFGEKTNHPYYKEGN